MGLRNRTKLSLELNTQATYQAQSMTTAEHLPRSHCSLELLVAGTDHRIARCRARWRRRLPKKTGIGAHRSLVPRLATLEADDLRPGLALRSRRPREGWSRARALLNWDGRADNCPPLLELLPLWLRIWNPGL